MCQACYKATKPLEPGVSKLLDSMPKPFLSLHFRLEPNMVAYSQCQYHGLSPASIKAIEAEVALVERKSGTWELARIWSERTREVFPHT